MVVLAGCQVTDFEWKPDAGYVRSIAAHDGSRMVVLLDRSAPTRLPVDTLDPACPSSCGEPIRPECPPGCSTRLGAAVEAVERILEHCRPHVEVAVVAFPGDGRCGEPQVVVPLGSKAPLEGLRPQLRALTPSGGRAAGRALDWLTRSPWVTELTDNAFAGLMVGPLDDCDGTPDGRCRSAPSPCVDLDPVAAAASLRKLGRRTWTVAMGGEPRPDALERIASAGGTYLSGQFGFGSFTPATFAASCEASFALTREQQELLCRHQVPPKPPGRSLLLVMFDGRRVETGPDTWVLDGTTLILMGEACAAARASSRANVFQFEVRWVTSP